MRCSIVTGVVGAIALSVFGTVRAAGAALMQADKPGGRVIAVKAGRIIPVAGAPIENGVVIVRDGKIDAIGKDLPIPEGAEVIEVPKSVVTPGLIDAHAAIDPEYDMVAATGAGRRGRRQTIWEEIVGRAAGDDRGADGGGSSLARLRDGLQTRPTRGADGGGSSRPQPGESTLPQPLPTREGSCAEPAPSTARSSPRSTEMGPPAYEAFVGEDAERVADGGLDGHGLGKDAGCLLCGAAPDTSDPRVAIGGFGFTWAEQSSEVTPQLRVIDGVNLLSNDFKRLLKSGVTTVWVSPDSASVIGMRGAVVKTGGPLGQRVVADAGDVKASMGSDPVRRGGGNRVPFFGDISFRVRRPTTRMGVGWVFRKAFYDAMRAAGGKEMRGADMPPADAVPFLMQILEGTLGLRIQARMQHDILTAIRLVKEVGIEKSASNRAGGWPFILEEATEAYQCLPELKAANVPVIYGPIFDTPGGWRAFTGEAGDPRLNSATRLRDAGIKFALTAHDMRDEEGLARQAMMAVRYGLSADEALAAITATPAELIGQSGKMGVLVPGTDADLVVWSGEPLSATSRAVVVMVNGTVAYRE